MFKTKIGKAAIFLTVTLAAAASLWAIAPILASASGEGTLFVQNDNGDVVRRQFSLSARMYPDGTAKGQAILHNPAFSGANGQKYYLQVDISCMKVIGNTAFFGGTTKRTNDPNLVDAVYFSVQDNGEPGRGVDKISRAFFFDDDPNTTGDPALCQLSSNTDLPLETIDSGNINVKNGQ